MCRIVTCGFPFAGEMAMAFPSILGVADVIKKAPIVKTMDFIHWMESTYFNFLSSVILGVG